MTSLHGLHLQTAREHLITTDELAALLRRADRAAGAAGAAGNRGTDGTDGTGHLVVLDATVLPVTGFDGHPSYVTGHEQYLISGHIPGTVFADLLADFSDPAGRYPFTRPDAERFARAASAVGIDSDATVIVYDDAVGQWAARLWWLLRSFGHDDVFVLDGGLRKWTAEERPLEVGHVAPRDRARFTADDRDGFWAGGERVRRAVEGSEPATLVCGVPFKEFTGETGHRPRRGHIPGSVSAPAARLVDRTSNTFLDDDALRSLFGGVSDAPGPIVTYCAGGIAAAADALALALIGRTDVAVYDESLNEWAADPTAPLVSLVE